MIKIALLTFLLIFLSSCHQGSSYVSRYGQSIVLNPNQKEVKEIKSENISNKASNKLAKKRTNPKKIIPNLILIFLKILIFLQLSF